VTALLDAYGLVKCLSAWNSGGTLRLHVVQNRVKTREEAILSMKKLRRAVGKHLASVELNFAGYIPFDRYLLHSISIQEPVVLSHPRAFVTACLKGMAHKVYHRYLSWERGQHSGRPAPSYFAKLEQQSHE